MIKIGIIGGSGLDNPDLLQNAQDLEVNTPYGKPSSPLKIGTINNVEVVLLARHGREHTIPPTQVNYRANIHALKEAGCTHILATTACGSLREKIGRGDFVILDQFIDFTRHRHITYYQNFAPGEFNHTPMAEPFDQQLRNILLHSCQELGLKYHPQGTVITIEGPRFSTKSESHMFRAWGADVINMSVAPEVILANEIGIPYVGIAMATDYDCWKEGEEAVTNDAVLEVFSENVNKVTSLLTNVIPKVGQEIQAPVIKEFDLKSTIRTIPNWPKEGIMFRDITTLLQNPEAFSYCIQKLKEQYQNKNIDKIAGIESRGFIFGAALAKELMLPFVTIRKPGKLPAEIVSQEYMLEYGTDKIEMHKDAIDEDDNILIVDDLLATGGTMLAACQLVERVNGKVAGCAVVVDLPDLKGGEKLNNYDLFKLVNFEGE
jgi:5'-methylthioadenosine phosphorylase